MASRIQLAQASAVGEKAGLTEDSLLTLAVSHEQARRLGVEAVIAAASGLGEGEAGQAASRAATSAIREFAQDEDSWAKASTPAEWLRQAFAAASKRVWDEGEEVDARPGCSLTVAALTPARFYIAHAGATRAYKAFPAGAIQLTFDDPVEADQAKARRLGLKPFVSPSVYDEGWSAGQVLYLATSGLAQSVSGDRAAEVFARVREIEEASREIAGLGASAPGGQGSGLAAAKTLGGKARAAAPAKKAEASPGLPRLAMSREDLIKKVVLPIGVVLCAVAVLALASRMSAPGQNPKPKPDQKAGAPSEPAARPGGGASQPSSSGTVELRLEAPPTGTPVASLWFEGIKGEARCSSQKFADRLEKIEGGDWQFTFRGEASTEALQRGAKLSLIQEPSGSQKEQEVLGEVDRRNGRVSAPMTEGRSASVYLVDGREKDLLFTCTVE